MRAPNNPSSSKLEPKPSLRNAHFPRFSFRSPKNAVERSREEEEIWREEVEREMAREAPLDIVTDSPRFSFSSGSCNWWFELCSMEASWCEFPCRSWWCIAPWRWSPWRPAMDAAAAECWWCWTDRPAVDPVTRSWRHRSVFPPPPPPPPASSRLPPPPLPLSIL